MTAPTTPRVTVEEFFDGDFPPGSWLLHGEVIKIDPTFDHQEICARLLHALMGWCQSPSGRGRAGFGGNWVLGPDTVLIPDAWWVGETVPSGIRSDDPPDLAVEVRFPGTWRYDLGPKREVYDRAGVAELWLVDPAGETVLVWRRTGRGTGPLELSAALEPADTLASPLLPGFELPVAELLSP